MSQPDETLFPPSVDELAPSPNWLVGVIDDPRQAEQAERDLIGAGFPLEDVLLLHGPEAVQRLRGKDEQRGLLGSVMKAIASIVTDAAAFQDHYAAEAEAGHALINLRVKEEGQIERARQIMVAHGAHYIKHFGALAVTNLD